MAHARRVVIKTEQANDTTVELPKAASAEELVKAFEKASSETKESKLAAIKSECAVQKRCICQLA